MTVSYKVLGQSSPSATTNTNLYTVGSGKQAIVSTLSIANRNTSAGSYRLAVRPDGATLSSEHYLAYDVAIAGNDTTLITTALALDAGDILTVYGSSASMSFGAYGSEIS